MVAKASAKGASRSRSLTVSSSALILNRASPRGNGAPTRLRQKHGPVGRITAVRRLAASKGHLSTESGGNGGFVRHDMWEPRRIDDPSKLLVSSKWPSRYTLPKRKREAVDLEDVPIFSANMSYGMHVVSAGKRTRAAFIFI